MVQLTYLFTIVVLITIHEYSSAIGENLETNDFEAVTGLANSNKIALGYNPIYGSPVCYSSACHMDGFASPIFKLNYRNPAPGSCTTQLVPDNVDLVCVPSAMTIAETDIITSLESLQQSIVKRTEFSTGTNFLGFSFAYKKSRETTYMVDTMLQKNKTVMYTSAQISFVKLSMFEPAMELSDNFRQVIENMPCCKSNALVNAYIRNELFGRYGLVYMPTIVLGGSAQQSILMEWTKYKKLVAEGININQESNVNFFVTTNGNTQQSHNVQTQTKFSSQISSKGSSFVGGTTYLGSINEWAQTISSSPGIIKFDIRNITNLLTETRFPNEANLKKKKKLIEQVLDEYIANPYECINNCTNALQGTCQPSGYFGLGLCQCKIGWYGDDCSKRGSDILSSSNIPRGTICGYHDGKIMVTCSGQNPKESCPPGYIMHVFSDIQLRVCFKSVASIQKSTPGTICGLVNVGANVDGRVACNVTFNQQQQDCPDGYKRFDYRDSALIAVCMSLTTEIDLPGTLCGMQRQYHTDGPDCDGFNPGLMQCPIGYGSSTWTHSSGNRLSVCYKKP